MENIRKYIAEILLPVFACSTIIYLVYHAIQGERGILSHMHLQHQVEQADATHEKVVSERQELEKKVKLLMPKSLDQDMLEETASRVLNLLDEGSYVILDQE